MGWKTKVKVTADVRQEKARAGDIGYIDGYVTAADSCPYACVVIGKYISLVPMYLLEVIQDKETTQ